MGEKNGTVVRNTFAFRLNTSKIKRVHKNFNQKPRKEMVPAPIITAAVISVLIASNYQTSILLPSGVFGATPVYSNVTDDTRLGTVPSLGPSSDLLYQDVRYRVLDTAERRYLATIRANSTLAPIKILSYKRNKIYMHSLLGPNRHP